MPVNTAITIRKGSSSQWSSANPVLASGEPGYDLSNKILKVGDGVSNWASLGSINLTSSNITDFNTATSGILPVKNIVAGNNITISSSSGIYTINSTASGVGGSSSTSVIEYSTVSNFPASGTGSTIYISTDNGRIYRWASTVYQELGPVSYAPIGSDSRWDLFLPAAPTSVTATPGNTQATVSWTAPTALALPITNYTLQYSSNSGSSWTTFTRSASTATSATVTGLTNGTAYVFRVAAVNGVGTGAYTAASSAVTPAVPASDANFSSVSLLLHMDGTGSSFTDSSVTPKTVTAFGNATQSATQAKFGGKSAYFDGSGDYLTIGANSAFSFPGDFTIEFWVFLAGNPNGYVGNYGAAIVNCYFGGSTPNGGWQVRINGTSSSYTTINLYTGSNDLNFAYTFAQNQWHYVAVSRVSSVIRAYVNGNQVGSSISNSDTFTPSSSNALSIGRLALESTYLFDLNGYIDDLRLTKGIGRYTGSTITVPTAAFPDS